MSTPTDTVTRADVCAAAIADAFKDDGEIFASPMGTMPMIGVRLAKLTSNPDLVISDGESLFLHGTPPIFAKADVVEGWIPFRKVFDVVAHGKRNGGAPVVLRGAHGTLADKVGQLVEHGLLECLSGDDWHRRTVIGFAGLVWCGVHRNP